MVSPAPLGLGRSTQPESMSGSSTIHIHPWYPRTRWTPWKTGRSLNTVSFQKFCFQYLHFSVWKTHLWRQLGFGSGVKGEQVQRRGREERSTINIQLVLKVELGSSPWTLQYGGEAREVQTGLEVWRKENLLLIASFSRSRKERRAGSLEEKIVGWKLANDLCWRQ